MEFQTNLTCVCVCVCVCVIFVFNGPVMLGIEYRCSALEHVVKALATLWSRCSVPREEQADYYSWIRGCVCSYLGNNKIIKID